MALLESLVRTEESEKILLQDSVEHNGRLLLKCFVCHWVQRYSNVHIFLFDAHPGKWLSGIPAVVRQRLTVHDGYSDPLGWNGGPALLKDSNTKTFLDRMGGDPGPNSAVVFDSISTLLLHHELPQICRILHQLGRQAASLLCLLHSDLHDGHVISQLCHVMSTSIEVQSVNPKLSQVFNGRCCIVHQKKSGKILRNTELFSVDGDLTVSATDLSSLGKGSTDEEKPPDPTANLTFNLTLTDKEKEERSKVILPYTYTSERKSAHLQVGSGRIFYQPDDVDDFDESDPDDDLDI